MSSPWGQSVSRMAERVLGGWGDHEGPCWAECPSLRDVPGWQRHLDPKG